MICLSVCKGLSKWGNSRTKAPAQPGPHSLMIHHGWGHLIRRAGSPLVNHELRSRGAARAPIPALLLPQGPAAERGQHRGPERRPRVKSRPLTRCMTFSKSLDFARPLFHHLIWGVTRLNEILLEGTFPALMHQEARELKYLAIPGSLAGEPVFGLPVPPPHCAYRGWALLRAGWDVPLPPSAQAEVLVRTVQPNYLLLLDSE